MTRRRRRRGVVVERDAVDELVPRGRCCACEFEGALPNLMMLAVRAPESAYGRGWGCFACGLPSDGAMAALCDRCVPPTWRPGMPRPGGEIRFACTGYVTEPGRVPVAELTEAFEHDMSKHPEAPEGYRA